MSGDSIKYIVCAECKDSKGPKCMQCAFEEVKTDAIINSINKLRKKRKLNIGGMTFTLENGDIITETAAKRTKTEQICEAMESFSALCKNLEDPNSIKEFRLGLRISLTFPVEKSVDEETDQ